MNRYWLLQPFSHAVLATALCGLAMGLLLLPQVRLQRPMAQGVISIHLAADGGLRLWNQPIAAAELRRKVEGGHQHLAHAAGPPDCGYTARCIRPCTTR